MGCPRNRVKSNEMFRFDRSDPQQESVYQLYKTASNWGTHGHYSVLVRGGRTEVIGPRQSVEVRQITDAGVREALILWLCGFLPIQVLCVEPFARAHPERFRRPTELLLKLGDLAGLILNRLREAEDGRTPA